jgi:adenine deaminase
LKVAAVDRRFSPGKTFVGLIRGFHLRRGAIASSGAWDTSNIIVVGADDDDMAAAVNRIRALQGGAVLFSEGRLLVEIPLPLFGLMSDLPLPELVARTDALAGEMKGLGFPFDEPLRPLMTLTGAAIPFLRISEEGLVDIKSGRALDLFVKERGRNTGTQGVIPQRPGTLRRPVRGEGQTRFKGCFQEIRRRTEYGR